MVSHRNKKRYFPPKTTDGIFPSPNGQNNTGRGGNGTLLVPKEKSLGELEPARRISWNRSPAARDLCQTRTEHGQVYFSSMPPADDVCDLTGCVLHEGKDSALPATVTLVPSHTAGHIVGTQ